MGDKTEAGAIAQTFARERTESSPLYVGSVKTNVGHTESTAGLAGILKALLILEKGIIPPNMNFAAANEAIPLGKWHIQVSLIFCYHIRNIRTNSWQIPQKLIPWPENQVRRASVNSFGYGGSNAHIILDGAEEYLTSNDLGKYIQIGYETSIKLQLRLGPRCDNSQKELQATNNQLSLGASAELERRRLFVLTHNTDQGIGKLAADLKRYVIQHDTEDGNFLDSLAHTLNSRRSKLAFRVSVSASSQEELITLLDEIAKGVIRPVRAVEEPKICFAFTGKFTIVSLYNYTRS